MKRIVIALCLLAGLGSCQIYRTYQRPELPEVDSLFRQPVQGADTTSFADLTWRELFTDSRLQRLIDSGIMNNSDLQIARLRVAEARPRSRPRGWPTFPPCRLPRRGAVNAPEHAPATRTYDLAAAAEWEVDLFGKLLNEKRGAAAALAGQEAYRQAVETQLVATVANSYYTLLMLDRQLEITRSTSEVWAENVRVMEALKRAGQTTEMAVAQTVAEQASVEASVLALERQVLQTENALCVLLGTTPRTIDRSTLDAQRFPDSLAAGIPLRLVDRRPDVRQCEAALAEAYYATNTARSAFYPSITLGGTAGWTNAAGAAISNPGQWLFTAVGSLVEPLFARGRNRANLKIAQAQQQEALVNFRQSLLTAGAEVNDALVQWQTARRRLELDNRQVEALRSALRSAELLMQHSSQNYLEVLTARQSLLQAELDAASDCFDKIQGIINLYHALGGGY